MGHGHRSRTICEKSTSSSTWSARGAAQRVLWGSGQCCMGPAVPVTGHRQRRVLARRWRHYCPCLRCRSPGSGMQVHTAPSWVGADNPELQSRQLKKLQALTNRLPGCGRLLHPSDPPVAEQFGNLSARCRDYAITEMLGRVLNVLLNAIVWVYGWRAAGAHWVYIWCASGCPDLAARIPCPVLCSAVRTLACCSCFQLPGHDRLSICVECCALV